MGKRLRLYETLGLDVTADEISIRRAFKRLSEPLRPEKNPTDADAPAQLQVYRDAYDVLADRELRAAYDEFGEAALQKGFNANEARRKLAREQELAARRAKAALIAPTAIERSQLGPDGTPLRRDWTLRVAIGKGTAHRGGLLRVPVARPVPCPRCDGSGRRDLTCPECKGARELHLLKPEPCERCHGIGLLAGEPGRCRRCRGWGRRGKSLCRVCGGCGLVVKRYECGGCAGRGLKSIPVTTPCGGCNSTGLKPCLRCDGEGKISKSLLFRLYVPRRCAEDVEYRYSGAGFSSRDGEPTDLYVQFAIVPRAPRR